MQDLISRQAAIDVADKFSDADGCNGSDVAMDIISGLISLPSVQPEPICVAKVTLTDEQVKEAFEKAKCEILAVPSAQSDKTYEQGWKEGREALRKEMWEDGRDRLD